MRDIFIYLTATYFERCVFPQAHPVAYKKLYSSWKWLIEKSTKIWVEKLGINHLQSQLLHKLYQDYQDVPNGNFCSVQFLLLFSHSENDGFASVLPTH